MTNRTWLRTAGMISAAAMALTLTACGGSSDSSDGVSAEPPATTTAAPEDPAEATGTFSVTGEESIEGDLSEVVCVPAEEGTQVTADISGSGTDGRLTVIAGDAPADHERGDSLTLQDDKIYSRISSDTLPYDIVEDGGKVTGTVVLADIQDIVEPDVDKRKQVTLEVDIDCGA